MGETTELQLKKNDVPDQFPINTIAVIIRTMVALQYSIWYIHSKQTEYGIPENFR